MRTSMMHRGLVLVAGLALAWLVPATPARAQAAYGYDSYFSYPNSAPFWYQPGQMAVYSDPSTGAFHYGDYIANRTIAPYTAPPYGAFPQGNGLPYVANRPMVMAPAAANANAVRKAPANRRRELIRKRK